MGVGKERGGVTLSVPVKANSGVRARVPAAGKVLEGDDKPTFLCEDQHYLHYITILIVMKWILVQVLILLVPILRTHW